MQNPTSSPGYATRWIGLLFIGLSVIIISMDNTILNNALPIISADLNATTSDLAWIVDAYILVFAALMLTMGAFGDRFGRKRALQVGLVLFAAASAGAALAPNTAVLILARAFLGVGGAMIMPASLSIINATFPRDEAPQAIAIWAAIFSLGIGIGPILGGWLVQSYGWHAIFFINLPVIAIAMVGCGRFLADSRDEMARQLDIVGVLLSIGGLFALVYAIIEVGIAGWASIHVIGGFIIALVLLGLFFWWEGRTPHAMLPLYLFKNPSFTAANTILAFTMFALFGSTFFLSQYLQSVLGFTPLEAGFRVLPVAIPMTIFATYSARIAVRIGTKYTVALGIGLAAVGLIYLSILLDVNTPYEWVMIGQLMMGTGLGIAVSPATTAIMRSVPVSKSGIGSAMNNTTRQLGGALGIAVLGTMMNSVYLNGVEALKAVLPASAHEAVAGSLQIAQRFATESGLDPQTTQQILDITSRAFVDGVTYSMSVGAVIMGLTALATLLLLPNRVVSPEAPSALEGNSAEIVVQPVGH